MKKRKLKKGNRLLALVMVLLLTVGLWNGYPAMTAYASGGPDTITLNFTNATIGTNVDGIQVNDINIAPNGSNSVTASGYGSSYSANETNTIVFSNAVGGADITSATIDGQNFTAASVTDPILGITSTVVTAVVPAADSYNITLTYGASSDDVTIVWAYDLNEAIYRYHDADAYVEHGKVEVVSITRGGSTIYSSGQNAAFVDITSLGGEVRLKKGDDVVLKLIPDYGYQLQSASVNGETLAPQDTVSTFKLTNIQGNLHFAGVFVPASDTINTSGTVTSASIANGQNAASSGNLKMDISDNGSYSTDVTGAVSGENVSQVASVDISLTQVVSKGTAGSNWTNGITSFSNPITVGINLGSTTPADGETFSVVRDHNGNLQELDATYDAASNTLYFPTNQFSTYTIVSKTADQTQTSSPVTSTPSHTHSYQWVVTTVATPERTGIYSYICSGCGRVDATQIIGRDAAMYQSVLQELAEKVAAVQNGTGQEPIVLNMGDWYSIPKVIMDKIRACGMDVIVNYRYQGKEYSILIPKGKCVDLRIPWYGPLLLEYLYGNLLEI
ncbi:MAG: hypothetical protein ACI4DW_03495 [Lachnospiraceae bacterium]